MSQPLVTVVVPIYNVEQYLDRCIESIINQTYSNLQIILVDDGSPDNCPAICDLWASRDNRITVIHKKNAGLGMSRNTGIENALGQYIFFFDSDDYVDITIIEKCVASALTHNADAVIYGRSNVYPDGRVENMPVTARQTIFHREQIEDELLAPLFSYGMGIGISAWGKMFSLNTINSHNLRFVSEREIVSEDAYFALEFFSAASTVTVLPENLYFYFKRESSLSQSYRQDRQERNDDFLIKSLAYINTAGLSSVVAAHLTVRYHFYTISAMKQILTSGLTKKEKRIALWNVFNSKTLHQSLTKDTLKLHNTTQRIFFSLLKNKCYPLCHLLLQVKLNRSR